MKANGLRIGNLYNHNGEIREVTPSTIEEVWNSERSWVKPIPLTEEWLLKFGFVIRNKHYSLNYGGESMRYAFFDIPRNKFILYFHGKYGFNCEEGRKNGDYCIIYVHQLQNLYFALTGEELKLKDHE